MKAERSLTDKSLFVIGEIDGEVNLVTPWVTFIAFMSWAFLFAQSINGPKSLWWIPVKIILVSVLWNLSSTAERNFLLYPRLNY
ncbi:MAG: hypothetical protein CMI18_10920 [Opitutaceae bacterium]|nr:hypothetical protein [Opitutaceae bacterium]|tara:strand:+ start:1129 stop:1380 length:252 start_codon:yes stop_codon:yes gene_type:complete